MVNVLVVEDDKRILQFCSSLLLGMNKEINVIPAENAENALALLNQYEIDGAVVDIGLPGMNGFSFVKKIRDMENYHFLPIIFESGEDKDYSETYKQYHNIDYISKPFTKKQFLCVSEKLIKEIYAHKKLINKKENREYIFHQEGKQIVVLFSDILFATTEKRRIKLVTRKNILFRSHYTLDNLITEIDSEMFVRCNKSYAVNIENIESIQQVSDKSWNIHFQGGDFEACQLSLNYKKKVEELLMLRQANRTSRKA